jgi:hypothetical protein
LKQHKPQFDEKCLGILDQRKQAKIQWIQDPSQNNVDNLNQDAKFPVARSPFTTKYFSLAIGILVVTFFLDLLP